MELTLIGFVQLAIGTAIVVAGSLRHAFLFLLLCGLFGGSAAIYLPALGGSSIQAMHFALLFVFLRILVPHSGFLGDLVDAFRANRWLALFALYGIAMTHIGPRLFAGSIDVWPLRMSGAETLFDTLPLEPTAQNITGAINLLGALLIAMASWIACRRKGGPETLVSATIGIGWAHVGFGLLALATRGTPADALLDEVFRTASYAQLDAEAGGFVRIRGIFPEASAYASFGYFFFVANAELWYRSIRSRATGITALLLAAVLFFSTSSTAYFGLAAYFAFFLLRALALPNVAVAGKVRRAFATVGLLIFLAAVTMATVPNFAQAVLDMVAHMTVDKPASDSAVQRLFWAWQGWDAFLVSYGLGIGPGSFRSSSMFMAILGSMGVIGIAGFLIYLGNVFQPWRISSWGHAVGNPAATLGGAYASAAVLSLLPAAVNAPVPHPSTTFAIFAGAALAFRPPSPVKIDEPEPRVQAELT